MISREEAITVYDIDDGYTNGDSASAMYDAIVKSIGSCGECEHFNNRHEVCNLFNAFLSYCSEFKPKETK